MKAVFTKHFDGRTIFENYSLELEKGKIYVLQGPSGRGKTTLLRMISALEENEAGDNGDFSSLKFSWVFQEDRLCSTMSAFSNVYYALGGSCDKAAIIEAFNDLGLDEPYKKIREYSGGMKRRVSLIRAMLADSDMVLLDEPFTGLDARSIFLACSFIRAHQNGRTIMLVTHESAPLPTDGCIEL